MKSPARYIADFVVAGNNILDASVTLADLGPDVLANLASAGANIAGLTTSNIAEGSNLYYTDERVYANINPLLANLDVGANLAASNTDALAEGTTNLYFSNDRVYANISPLLFSGEYSDLANVPVIPTTTSNLINDSGFITTDSLNTSNVTEGINLYYTDERVYANVAPLLEVISGNVDLTPVYANINNLSNSINALFAFNDQVDIDGGVYEGDIDGGDWQYDPNAVDLDAGAY